MKTARNCKKVQKSETSGNSLQFLEFALITIVLLLFCGCTKTVSKARLDAKATEHAGFTFPDQTYYVGSSDRYDYFVIRRGLGSSGTRYRVLQSEGAVANRFKFTKDETRWRGYGLTGIIITNRHVAKEQ
jgi:hypothetical protein